jgi:dihydrodipicolinate synthase/N-acetylneuraminate lyase
MTEPIRGVLPIAHTPFREDDSIDFESFRRQIDWAP